MIKLVCVSAIILAVAYAEIPHHQLAESVDEDVRRFGELIDELVAVFEKGKSWRLEFKKVFTAIFGQNL